MALWDIKTKVIPLIDDYIIPPFSYLDTRQKYWQDRRNMWNKYVQDTTETRDDSSRSRTFVIQRKGLEKRTSTFDPVLAELMYKWFLPKENIKILDPFGGEQVKGIVAGALGYDYYGVEIRQEQVDLNMKLAEDYPKVKYFCGDSKDIDSIISDRDFTLLFTSPPYYNLEKYSYEDDDISTNQSYDDFMNDMKTIFSKCYSMMGDVTFAVLKVGEIRTKETDFYGFVPDTINMMKECGWKYYNEMVLLNSAGTAGIRTQRNMQTRKIVKTHQNILVFYKGDNVFDIRDKFVNLRSYV